MLGVTKNGWAANTIHSPLPDVPNATDDQPVPVYQLLSRGANVR